MLTFKTPEKEMDLRIREKLIHGGMISPKQVAAFLKGLKDESDNIVEIDQMELDDQD